jgi:hypothetical protein
MERKKMGSFNNKRDERGSRNPLECQLSLIQERWIYHVNLLLPVMIIVCSYNILTPGSHLTPS